MTVTLRQHSESLVLVQTAVLAYLYIWVTVHAVDNQVMHIVCGLQTPVGTTWHCITFHIKNPCPLGGFMPQGTVSTLLRDGIKYP